MGCSTSVASKNIAAPIALVHPRIEEPVTERPDYHKEIAQEEKADQENTIRIIDDPSNEAKPNEQENLKNQSIDQNGSVCNATARIQFPGGKPRTKPYNTSTMGVPDSLR